MFSKNIRTLYLYIVSFLSLFAIIYGSVALVEKITNYFYPVSYINDYYDYDRYDYDEYQMKQTNAKDKYEVNAESERRRKNEQIQTVKEIFTNVAILLVASVIYSYHWKMVQKEHNKEGV